MPESSTVPLSGIRILDLTWVISGPSAGARFAAARLGLDGRLPAGERSG